MLINTVCFTFRNLALKLVTLLQLLQHALILIRLVPLRLFMMMLQLQLLKVGVEKWVMKILILFIAMVMI